jgi:toxin ParE1/3/4
VGIRGGGSRYEDLLQAVDAFVGETPAAPESSVVRGVRVYPLRLARHLAAPDQRGGRPRHIVVYRVALDGVTEIIGIAHDRMLLTNAVRRMLREGGH